MDVEELKRHIHKELFGECFPGMPAGMEWTGQRKDTIMLRAVKIMQRHHQSIEDIERMLEEKFCLAENEVAAFLEKAQIIPKQPKEE